MTSVDVTRNNRTTPFPTEAHVLPASAAACPEPDALLDALCHLEAALELASAGREQGNSRIVAELREVYGALSRYSASSEAPDGLLAEIDRTRPALFRRGNRLRREQVKLLIQASSLLVLLEQASHDKAQDFADIRHRVAGALRDLRQHRARETDLVFECYLTDIGAGD